MSSDQARAQEMGLEQPPPYTPPYPPYTPSGTITRSATAPAVVTIDPHPDLEKGPDPAPPLGPPVLQARAASVISKQLRIGTTQAISIAAVTALYLYLLFPVTLHHGADTGTDTDSGAHTGTGTNSAGLERGIVTASVGFDSRKLSIVYVMTYMTFVRAVCIIAAHRKRWALEDAVTDALGERGHLCENEGGTICLFAGVERAKILNEMDRLEGRTKSE